MSEPDSNDGLSLELSVTEKQVLKQLVRLEARMNKSAAKMEENWNKSSRNAMRRVDKMNRDIGTSIDRAMMRVGNSSKAALGSLFGGLLAGGLVGVAARARETVRGIARVGDEAKRAGVSVKDLQEWKFVAEQNRIGPDQMIDGLKELNLRADEFIATGKGPAAEAFARLGYSGEELSKKLKTPSALLLEIVDRMGQMETAARIRVADEVFGGSAGERFVELVAQGEEGLRRTIRRAHEVGAVMDDKMIAKAAELDRKFTEIGASVSRIGKEAVVGWALMIDDLRDSLDGLNDVRTRAILGGDVDTGDLGGIKPDLQEFTALSDILIENVKELSKELSGVSREVDELGNPDLANDLGRAADNMSALVFQLENGMIDMQEFNEKLLSVVTGATDASDELRKIDEVGFSTVIVGIINVSGALQRIIDKMRDLRREAAAEVGTEKVYSGRSSVDPRATPGLAPTTSPRPRTAPPLLGEGGRSSDRGGGSGSKSFADEVTRLRERTAALEAEAAALMMVAAAGGKYATSIDYARKKAELLTAAQREGKKITPELKAQIEDLATAYAEAAHGADMASDRLERMQDSARRGEDAMTDLFMSIFEGADGARAALGNLLMQIAKVQAQNAIGSMSGAGGFFGWLGGLLTPSVTPATSQADLGPKVMPSAVLPRAIQQTSEMGFARSSRQAKDVHIHTHIDVTGANGDEAIKQIAEEATRKGIEQAAPRLIGASVDATYERSAEYPLGKRR